MAKKHFYVITGPPRAGIGIYNNWPEVAERVLGCKNARYKGFPTYAEACEHMRQAGIQRWPETWRGVRSRPEPRTQPIRAAQKPAYYAIVWNRQPSVAAILMGDWDSVKQRVSGTGSATCVQFSTLAAARDYLQQNGMKNWDETDVQRCYEDYMQQDQRENVQPDHQDNVPQPHQNNMQQQHAPCRVRTGGVRTARARKARERRTGVAVFYAVARGKEPGDIGIYPGSLRYKVFECTNEVSGANCQGFNDIESARKFLVESCVVQWREPDGSIFTHVPANPSTGQKAKYLRYSPVNHPNIGQPLEPRLKTEPMN